MRKLLINNSTDPAFNLALEELLATDFREPAVMLWRNAPSVIVGRNQNTNAEVNDAEVRKRRIMVVRRMTGGGAVYHDLGNINYTITAADRLFAPEAFANHARIITDVLHQLGVDAEFHGRNDILVDGRKVSGSAKTVFPDRTLFHGTLLFDTDLTVLAQVLTPDEEKIKAKGIRSVRSRVANLQEFLPQFDRESFFQELSCRLLDLLGEKEVTPLPEKLLEKADELAGKKYRTWEWNFGSVTDYSYCRKKYFAGGCVEVKFNIRGNRIADMAFSGDFFGASPVEELAAKLNGALPGFDDISGRLAAIDTAEFISGVSKDELLTLFALV